MRSSQRGTDVDACKTIPSTARAFTLNMSRGKSESLSGMFVLAVTQQRQPEPKGLVQVSLSDRLDQVRLACSNPGALAMPRQ